MQKSCLLKSRVRADRKADVNQTCQQSVFSPIGACIRIWCTAGAVERRPQRHVHRPFRFSLSPVPRSTKGLFTGYQRGGRGGFMIREVTLAYVNRDTTTVVSQIKWSQSFEKSVKILSYKRRFKTTTKMDRHITWNVMWRSDGFPISDWVSLDVFAFLNSGCVTRCALA